MPQLLLKGVPIGIVQGVLFDKDGTLSNSEEGLLRLAHLRIEAAKNIFLKKVENPDKIVELEKLLNIAYGLSREGLDPNKALAIASRSDNLIATATIFSLLGETWPQSIAIATQVFDKVDLVEKEITNKSKKKNLLPGVRKFLEDLQQANVTCALISNDNDSGIKTFLNTNHLEKLFQCSWSAENQPAKPNPEAVQNLCKAIGLIPQECALVGDADTDLLMARQAGVGLTLGYLAGWRKKPKLTAHHELIHHWSDLTVIRKPKVPDVIGSR